MTNLVRHGPSGTYYARVKVNGKDKWRTLKTTVFGVAKLRLGDSERETRGQPRAELAGDGSRGETTVARSIAVFRERTRLDPSLAPRTRERRESCVKALLKTWPELPARDIRRVTVAECREWAARTMREGTGFVAPRAKTKRTGMSASSFNKVVDVLRAIFEIGK